MGVSDRREIKWATLDGRKTSPHTAESDKTRRPLSDPRNHQGVPRELAHVSTLLDLSSKGVAPRLVVQGRNVDLVDMGFNGVKTRIHS